MKKAELTEILSYGPKYISGVMHLLTQPSDFMTSQFSKKEPTKGAVGFLCASFVVATARILYGEFSSIEDVQSKLRWDSVVTFAFAIGMFALAIHMALRTLRSSLSRDECLIGASYCVSAFLILVAAAYSICMPLLTNTKEIFDNVTAETLGIAKFAVMQVEFVMMFAAIVIFLCIWPLYLLWGLGRSGRLGVVKNIGFTAGMVFVSSFAVVLVVLSTKSH